MDCFEVYEFTNKKKIIINVQEVIHLIAIPAILNEPLTAFERWETEDFWRTSFSWQQIQNCQHIGLY
jgi:hypothetical protein